MRLIRRHLEVGATMNRVQVGHHRTAVECAIAGIGKMCESNLTLLGPDTLTSEMEEGMREWVIESLLHGAYLREYHLWEKACKAYLVEMAKRNGQTIQIQDNHFVLIENGQKIPIRGKNFVLIVKCALVRFGVTVPAHILDAIEGMRDRANKMKHKHDVGLEDHFISNDDYMEGVSALERFWEHLEACESIIG
jgi:hypothetical protein